ncbi:MAG: Mut7-C RNAse domain-containing protein [Thermodesulfobacteriota bacterium]|nr:Mut7-C RNAse domain-containing protein [Thermodesulfobacteriota bacterium]
MGLKFAADSMLGGLAKWLRLLGLDTIYLREGPARVFPDRVLVTRRSKRPHQPRLDAWPRVVTLSADQTRGQLTELVKAMKLNPGDLKPLTRCSVCNRRLHLVNPSEVAGRIPEYVQRTQTKFSECPGCGHIYWPGTHHARMLAVMEEVFGEPFPKTPA